jgi:hypothetical protein
MPDTGLAVNGDLEPFAVWDGCTRDWSRDWTPGELTALDDWMRENFGTCYRDACRFEVYVLDGPFAVVHAHERNGEGRWHRDPAAGGFAVAEPVTVPLAGLPPALIVTHLADREPSA